MTKKIMVILLVAFVSTSLSIVACELDEGDADGGDGYEDSNGGGGDLELSDYNCVKIDDHSGPRDSLDAESPGADIDCAVIEKANGEKYYSYAFRRSGSPAGCDDNAFDYVNNAFGEPGDNPDATYDKFFSLCGEGGYVILDFGNQTKIENGDTIIVYELGQIVGSGNENTSITVSAANYRNEEVELGTCGSGTCEVVVSGI